jgi:hypothetical protein
VTRARRAAAWLVFESPVAPLFVIAATLAVGAAILAPILAVAFTLGA